MHRATSAVTRTCCAAARRRVWLPRDPLRKAPPVSTRVARIAGRTPNSKQVTMVAIRAKNRTEAFIRTLARRQSLLRSGSDRAASTASPTPAIPPLIARTAPSVRSWRISRLRPAPSAARITSSRVLAVARTSMSEATFPHAIRRTRPTPPNITSSAGRKSLPRSSRKSRTRILSPRRASG